MFTLWFTVAAAGPRAPVGVSPELEFVAEELGRAIGPGRWMTPAPAPIVNGSVVEYAPNRVVALALVDVETGDAFAFCSGSLIAARWVLTAAHCLLGLDEAYYGSLGLTTHVVWGGSVSTYTDAIPWSSSIVSPGYVVQLNINDLGLVELEEPKLDVQWMVLNDAPMDANWAGTELTFFGYGRTSSSSYSTGLLRSVEIPLSSFDDSNLYTFDDSKNICSGDSGGPSTYEGPDGSEQVGINAFMTGSTCEGSGGGSTRVDPHIDWIRSYVPEVVTDYADLPLIEPEPEPPDAVTVDDTRDVDWLDEVFYQEPESGCATAGPTGGGHLRALIRRRGPS